MTRVQWLGVANIIAITIWLVSVLIGVWYVNSAVPGHHFSLEAELTVVALLMLGWVLWVLLTIRYLGTIRAGAQQNDSEVLDLHPRATPTGRRYTLTRAVGAIYLALAAVWLLLAIRDTVENVQAEVRYYQNTGIVELDAFTQFILMGSLVSSLLIVIYAWPTIRALGKQ